MEALPPAAGSFQWPMIDFHTNRLEGQRTWRKLVGGSYQGLQVGVSQVGAYIPLANTQSYDHAPLQWRLGNMVQACVQAEAEGMDFGKLLGVCKGIECGGVFIYIANLNNPVL